MVVVPCAATCDPEISFIVISRVRPFPDIAEHVVATEGTDAAAETNNWGRCACAEFCGVASRFVDFVSPREKSVIGDATCSVLPLRKRRQSAPDITGIRLSIFTRYPDDRVIPSVCWINTVCPILRWCVSCILNKSLVLCVGYRVDTNLKRHPSQAGHSLRRYRLSLRGCQRLHLIRVVQHYGLLYLRVQARSRAVR